MNEEELRAVCLLVSNDNYVQIGDKNYAICSALMRATDVVDLFNALTDEIFPDRTANTWVKAQLFKIEMLKALGG